MQKISYKKIALFMLISAALIIPSPAMSLLTTSPSSFIKSSHSIDPSKSVMALLGSVLTSAIPNVPPAYALDTCPTSITTDTIISSSCQLLIGSPMQINAGVTLSLGGGVTLYDTESTITNYGTIRGGIIMINNGVFDNYGNIIIGTLEAANNGIINNHPGGMITNNNIITLGDPSGPGTINNFASATIVNGGNGINIYANAFINNAGTINNPYPGIINYGNFINSGTINEICQGQIGPTPVNNVGGMINNISCLGVSVTAPPTGTVGTPVAVFANPTGGQAPYSFLWTMTPPSGSHAALTSNNVQNPTLTPDVPGTYQLFVGASDALGQVAGSGLAVSLVVTASQCGLGTFSPTENAPCTLAPPGSFVDTTGATSATLCALGTYQPLAGQTSCLQAPAGSYVSTTGATSSTFCAVGFFTDLTGQSVCTPAPAGSYVSTTGATSSTFCAAGTYQPLAGQTSCVQAPPGTYVSTTGAISSTICPAGTYCPTLGTSTPLTCPAGTTSNAGAISCTPIVPPSVSITLTPTPVLVGTTETLSASITDPGCPSCVAPTSYSYAWSLVSAPSGSSASLSSTSDSSPTFTPDLPGNNYQVSLVVTDSLGHSSAPTSTTFSASLCGTCVPTVSPTASPNPDHVGTVVTLDANPSETGCPACVSLFTYHWSIVSAPAGSTASLSSDSAQTLTVTSDVSGSYQFSVVATDPAGQVSTPGSVTVTAATPVSGVTISNTAPSLGNPVQLSANPECGSSSCGTSETISYHWSLDSKPSGSTATLSSSNVATPTFTPDILGDYSVSLAITDVLGNTATASKSIIVVLPPIPPTITGANAVTVGKSYSASITPRAGMTYSWTITGGTVTGLTDPTTPSITFVPNTISNLLLSCTETNGVGDTATGSKTISVVPQPITPTIIAPTAVTAGKPYTASVTPRSGMTYLWTISDGSITGPANAPSITFTAGTPGTLTLSATEINAASDTSAPGLATATVFSVPAAEITISPSTTVSTGTTMNLGESITGGKGPFSYAWTMTAPHGSTQVLSDPTAANPSFVPDLAGEYQLSLTVADSLGTSSTPVFATITAETPAQATQNLIITINGMNLNTGETTSLDSKLQAVINSLNAHNNTAAKNQLNAFINEVNAQTGKKITSAQAALLMQAYQNILHSIQ